MCCVVFGALKFQLRLHFIRLFGNQIWSIGQPRTYSSCSDVRVLKILFGSDVRTFSCNRLQIVTQKTTLVIQYVYQLFQLRIEVMAVHDTLNPGLLGRLHLKERIPFHQHEDENVFMKTFRDFRAQLQFWMID